MVLTHRGYGAYISCDSKEVETFQVKSKTHVVSCYIPSDDGVEYRVHWVDSKPPTHLSMEIRVDGRRIGVSSHTKGSSRPGIRLPLEPFEAFKFSHASTSEDALPSAYSEDLGTIEVRLRRVRDFVPIPHVPRATAIKDPATKRSGKHGLEAARRGSSYTHASSSAGRKSATQTRTTILRPILIDDKPYVIFRFLYRPREVLKDDGIIPVSEPSSPTTMSSAPSRRKKRPPVAEKPSTHRWPAPPPRKRQRSSISNQGISKTHDENGPPVDPVNYFNNKGLGEDDPSCMHGDGPIGSQSPMSAPEPCDLLKPAPTCDDVEDDHEEERMAHLSSRTGWAHTHMNSGPVKFEAEEPPDPIDDVHAPGPTPSYESQEDVKPVVEGVSEPPIVEVRINSRNQHLVFGNRPTSPPGRHVVKKEESPEPGLNIAERVQYSSPSRVKREEEVIHEVHICSSEIRQALNNALSRVKTEV